MLTPPRALTRNSHLAVLAASSPSEMPRILEGVRNLEARGLRITLAPNIDARSEHGYLAGSDDLRVQTFNQFLRDPQYDGFLFARGGYGVMRILDRIDYDAIAANPRPIVGFSDVTALHQAIAIRCGLTSFHGPMVNLDFHDGLSPANEEWFFNLLGGEAPLQHRFDRADVLADGETEGVLFGGCLSLTAALAGTPFDYWIEGGIWFWEEIDERPYRIDRMLTTLRLSGRLPAIRGVIVGRLKGCGTDSEIDRLLLEFFGPLSIPVVRNFPFGHLGDNLVMPIGSPVRLNTSDCTMTLLAPATRRVVGTSAE